MVLSIVCFYLLGYLRLAESKLKALSVAVRLRKPDKQFETFKNYGIELQVYFNEFQYYKFIKYNTSKSI